MESTPVSPRDIPTHSRSVPVDQRIILLRLYGESQSIAAEACRRYNATHITSRPVNARYVRRLVKKFDKTGSICNIKQTGRPRTATDEVSACAVLHELSRDRELSVGRIAQHCDTSPSSVYRILKDKKFRKYGVLQLQVLQPCDSVARLAYCKWFLDFTDVHSILFTDESIFRLHGADKRHVWAANNPRLYCASRVQHGAQLMAWAGLTGQKIIGPFFFSKNVTGKLAFNKFNALLF